MMKLFSSICLFLYLISPEISYATTYSNATQGESEVSIRIINKIDQSETQRKLGSGQLPKTGNQSYHNNVWLLGLMFIVCSLKIICKKDEKT